MLQNSKMKPTIIKLITPSIFVLVTGLSTVPANADIRSAKNISTKQIIIDTGGGGGEGSALPGVRWTFADTAKGTPFMFWSWSPIDR